ncbi:MAG: tRNA pseudouridine(38-40) synthase TruA [Anaerolineae bacterium]|nr:tRNA pseudouridine(38-40) synthase TruA [Anaerolineae bacterium]
MQRYKAILAYDGTRYSGFQKQAGAAPTILGTVEAALTKLNEQGTTVRVLGAGRTDVGVHASGQVISFDLDGWKHGDDTLLQAVNATLPTDIAILRLERAAADFHPRFDARSRTYRYLVYAAPVRQPLLGHNHWQIRVREEESDAPHLDRMQQAAAQLPGIHDFAAFGSAPEGEAGVQGSTVRQVFRSEWTEALPDQWGGRVLTYTIEANAFLYHMVRAIVAGLVDVGMNRMSVEAFTQRFRDRRRFGKLAPPHGLTLIEVKYETDSSGTTPAGD